MHANSRFMPLLRDDLLILAGDTLMHGSDLEFHSVFSSMNFNLLLLLAVGNHDTFGQIDLLLNRKMNYRQQVG